MASIIVGAIVAVLLFFALRHVYHNVKRARKTAAAAAAEAAAAAAARGRKSKPMDIRKASRDSRRFSCSSELFIVCLEES